MYIPRRALNSNESSWLHNLHRPMSRALRQHGLVPKLSTIVPISSAHHMSRIHWSPYQYWDLVSSQFPIHESLHQWYDDEWWLSITLSPIPQFVTPYHQRLHCMAKLRCPTPLKSFTHRLSMSPRFLATLQTPSLCYASKLSTTQLPLLPNTCFTLTIAQHLWDMALGIVDWNTLPILNCSHIQSCKAIKLVKEGLSWSNRKS